MTLPLYIARRFLSSFALVFAVFFGILYLVDMVEQIRRFDAGTVSFSAAAGLAALNVPASIYRIMPLLMILAALLMFLALARSSELVVIRAAGQSALRSLVPPFLTAILIGGAAVAVLNPIVAATSKQYETLADRYARGEASVMSISREGLWLRQGGIEGQTVIHAARANLDGTELYEVSFITFAPEAGPTRRIEAASAELGTSGWVLTDAKEWLFNDQPNPERAAQIFASMTVPSDLTADQIRDSFGTPSAIPIWELPGYIDSLEKAGFSARKHLVWFQMELALPLFLVAMVLIGAGFTMRHTRLGKTGMMVLYALLFGFGLYFIRNFAQVLGENGQIPAALAAWSPPVAGILASLGLLLHLEDG
jgi:lipopolysaccharide export system permease protein